MVMHTCVALLKLYQQLDSRHLALWLVCGANVIGSHTVSRLQVDNSSALFYQCFLFCLLPFSSSHPSLQLLFRRKFDFFPKGTAGADGWMSLYFKFADQFSDNQQIGFGFKLHVINFQFPSQTLTKGM